MPSIRSDVTKEKLASRIQHLDEPYASYIEDVLALGRRLDENMAEADQLRHILNGIAPFSFNALAVQNSLSVSDELTTYHRLDQL